MNTKEVMNKAYELGVSKLDNYKKVDNMNELRRMAEE